MTSDAYSLDNSSNLIIKKAYKEFFVSSFFETFTYVIGTLVDTAVSGLLFDMNALAGVGICSTFMTFFFLIASLLLDGFIILISNSIGRGNITKANKQFSTMFYINLSTCMLFIIAFIPFSNNVVYFLGAKDPLIRAYANTYFRISLIAMLFNQVQFALYKMMLLLGYKRGCAMKSVVCSVFNIMASLFFVLILGTGIEGLGYGTIFGYICGMIFLLIVYFAKPQSLKFYFRLGKESITWTLQALRYSIPNLANQIGDFVTGVVLNNIIAIFIGPAGLAIYTVFQSIKTLETCTTEPASTTLSNLTSTLMGACDVSGIKKVIKSNFSFPIIISIILSVVFLIFKVPILSVFGVTDSIMINTLTGAFVWLILVCILKIVNDTSVSFYTIAGHTLFASFFTVGADFLLYVPTTALLIGRFGLGISMVWVMYPACYITFFICIYLFLAKRAGKMRLSLDDIMMLPSDLYNDKNLLNYSMIVKKDSVPANFEKMHSFLIDHGYDVKTAYRCELCLEELSMRILEQDKKPTYIDIRLFVSENHLKFSIRADGPANNYLVFEKKDEFDGIGIEIVRNISQNVSYNYMAGFNVLNVEVM